MTTADIPKNISGTMELPTARSRFATKLYRKTAAIPAKIHSRYSRMSGATVPGTRRNTSIPFIPAYTAIFKISATAPIAINAVKIPFSSRSRFFAPNCMEKKALLPMHRPIMTDVINTISV